LLQLDNFRQADGRRLKATAELKKSTGQPQQPASPIWPSACQPTTPESGLAPKLGGTAKSRTTSFNRSHTPANLKTIDSSSQSWYAEALHFDPRKDY
jgi:hypothetical protein